MPYLVLAIGLLMSATGLSAIWFGYPIIQVERGWASVIAGATLLTGGLVTMALGLMFRTLVEVKSTLLRATGPSLGDPVDPELGGVPILTPALVPVVPALEGVLAPESPHASTHHGQEPASPSPDDERRLGSVLEPEARRPMAIDEHALFAAAIDDDLAPPHHSETAHESHDAPVLEPQAREPKSGAIGAPPTAHDPGPLDPKPSPDQGGGDWLDRAFSDLDHELGTPRRDDVQALRPEPTIPPPAVQAPSAPVAEPSPAYEPHADVALADRPAATGDVIGRYEADGTFYTMYADGSIEAQSEAGLYRFASMAELRAFIEG